MPDHSNAHLPSDEQKEEENDEPSSRRRMRAGLTVTVHEAPANGEDGFLSANRLKQKSAPIPSKRRVLPTWEDKKRVSLAQKKMKDPEWM